MHCCFVVCPQQKSAVQVSSRTYMSKSPGVAPDWPVDDVHTPQTITSTKNACANLLTEHTVPDIVFLPVFFSFVRFFFFFSFSFFFSVSWKDVEQVRSSVLLKVVGCFRGERSRQSVGSDDSSTEFPCGFDGTSILVRDAAEKKFYRSSSFSPRKRPEGREASARRHTRDQ